jgi:hypothetical protein
MIMMKDVIASTDSGGHVVLFAHGSDGACWFSVQTTPGDTTFGPWESLGGTLTSGPSAALDSAGLLMVFARLAASPEVQFRRQDSPGSNTFSEWAPVPTA